MALTTNPTPSSANRRPTSAAARSPSGPQQVCPAPSGPWPSQPSLPRLHHPHRLQTRPRPLPDGLLSSHCCHVLPSNGGNRLTATASWGHLTTSGKIETPLSRPRTRPDLSGARRPITSLLQVPSWRGHGFTLSRLPAPRRVGRFHSEYPEVGRTLAALLAGRASPSSPPPLRPVDGGDRPRSWRNGWLAFTPPWVLRRAAEIRRWQQAATLRQWVANRRRWQSAPLDTLRLHLAAEQINDSVDALARTQLSTFEPWLRRAFKPSGPPASLSCFIPAGSR